MTKHKITLIIESLALAIGLILSIVFFMAWRSTVKNRAPESAWLEPDIPCFDRSELARIEFNDNGTPGSAYILDVQGPNVTVQAQHFSSTLEGIKNPPAPNSYLLNSSSAINGRIWIILNHLNAAFNFNEHPDYGFYYVTNNYCHPNVKDWDTCYDVTTYIDLLMAYLEKYGAGKSSEQETITKLDELIGYIEQEDWLRPNN